MKNINVINSIMGSGKSTFFINKINDEASSTVFDSKPDKKFIVITLLLDESGRYVDACPSAEFRSPKNIKGRKLFGLNHLLQAGENIVTTHQLFKLMDRDTFDLIKGMGYTLVIDEVLDCVHQYVDLTKDDIKMLADEGLTYIDDNKRIRWSEPTYKGKFENIMPLCKNGNLIHGEKDIIIWEFPIDFFSLFDEVWIGTYLWHGSLMRSYLESHKIDVYLHGVEGGNLIPYLRGNDRQTKEHLKSLITIVDNKRLNAIGEFPPKVGKGRPRQPLSSGWFDAAASNESKDIKTLKKNLLSFFSYEALGPAGDAMWTTLKKMQSRLAGKGYTRGFVPSNAKATNEYRHKKRLAYMTNVYLSPIIKNHLNGKATDNFDDLFALSEMLQWIFRSQIRDGKPIAIYIPSARMRRLLDQWLTNKLNIDMTSLL